MRMPGRMALNCALTIVLATAAAAIKAMRQGGQAGCPTRREVDEFLQGAVYRDMVEP